MSEPISKWLESFWANKDKPAQLKTGQVWTLFHSGQHKEGGDAGTLAIILRVDDEGVHVILTHDEVDYKRGIDIVLNESHLDFCETLIVMPDTETIIYLSRFESASYLGNINNDGLEFLLDGRRSYQKIIDAQICLQSQESVGEISEEQINMAFKSGILKLLPLKVSKNDFKTFQRSLIKNIVADRTVKSDSIHERHDLNKSIAEIVQLNKRFKMLPLDARITEKTEFKEKKLQLLVPVLYSIAKVIEDSGIGNDEYRIAYDILHNIVYLDPENHELAKLYIKTAMLGGSYGSPLPIKSDLPAVKLLMDNDQIQDIVDPDLNPCNWDLNELEETGKNKLLKFRMLP